MPIAAAAIPAVGSLISGFMGSSAAAKAAKQQRGDALSAAAQINNTTDSIGKNIGANQQLAAAGVNAASDKAVGTVNDSTQNANSLLQSLFGNTNSVYSPYVQAGNEGVNGLAQGFAPGGQFSQQFSFDPTQISKNPNYQFALDQGEQAVNRSAAAQGSVLGGGNQKALMQYAQGLATNTINDAYNQALTTFQTNRGNALSGLTTLAGLGQFGASGQANANQNLAGMQNQNLINAGYFGATTPLNAAMYAGNTSLQAATTGGNWQLQGAQDVANLFGAAGNASAAGTIGGANAWQNALGGIANAGTSAAVNWGSMFPPKGVSQPNYIPAPPMVPPLQYNVPPPNVNWALPLQ